MSVVPGKRRRMAYDLYAIANEPLHSEDNGVPVEDVRDTIALTIKQRTNTWTSAEQVGIWLNNPDKHSPYIDDIAVERALDFDWDVFDNLTPDERDVVYKKLARMKDPWGGGRDPELDRVIDMHATKNGASGAPTQRGNRYSMGTRLQRNNVRVGVARVNDPQSA
jgi:hypothetical protein